MKLTPSYSYLKNGERIINGYKVSLTKSLTEQAGFTTESELEVKYDKDKITIKRVTK